jgi:lysophospholipase L1-like esterase
MTERRPRLATILLFNLALGAILLIVLELIFGHWFNPNLTDRLHLTRNCERRYDATALYDDAHEIVYKRDKWALRGYYSSLGDIDILTMGGSATDQRYITEGETWQDVMARRFAGEGRRVSVVNAGVDGQSSYGHIKDFDWWFSTLPGFKPRYILFYVGGNDMFKGDDSEFDDLVSERPPTLMNHIRERSATFHLAQTAVGMYRARKVHKISHRREPFDEWEWTTEPMLADPRGIAAQSLERYGKALALLARKTRELGAVPIFVTQSLAAYRYRADGTLEGHRDGDVYHEHRINGVDYYNLMSEFWKVTMEECRKADGICIDAGSEIRWEPGDFYDTIHNTPQGAKRLGEYLHSKLRDLPVGTENVAR